MTMGRSRTHLTIDNALASVRYSVIRGGGGSIIVPSEEAEVRQRQNHICSASWRALALQPYTL